METVAARQTTKQFVVVAEKIQETVEHVVAVEHIIISSSWCYCGVLYGRTLFAGRFVLCVTGRD